MTNQAIGSSAKCCYAIQAFQSDDERRFAVLIDGTADVLRWVKPARQQFVIEYKRRQRYDPDFVIETSTEKLVGEVKARNEMDDPEGQGRGPTTSAASPILRVSSVPTPPFAKHRFRGKI